MKKLILLIILATVFISCKNPVQDEVKNEEDRTVETETQVETETEPEVIPVNPWSDAVYDESDKDCSVSYIYLPKGWNPSDFDKDVYEYFSKRTEENFDFIKFEKIGTLTFNSTDEDVIKGNNTYIFSKRNYYSLRTPDEYCTELDYYKVSVNKDFDLDYICMVYKDLNCYNGIMYNFNAYTGYTLEKDEDGTWYLYTCIWYNEYQSLSNRELKDVMDLPKYPKWAINNYN